VAHSKRDIIRGMEDVGRTHRHVGAASVEQQHDDLREFVARLEREIDALAGGDLSDEAETRRLIDSFCSLLTRHLQSEEDSGVLVQAAEAEPRLATRVEALLAEHEGLRQGIEGLEGGAPGGDWSGFQARFVSFCGLLSLHEQAENEVLMEAYLDDLGGHN
jgi:hypothetical protein